MNPLDAVAARSPAPALTPAGKPLQQRFFGQVNWRGLAAIGGFLLLWEILVRMKVPGFAAIPTPLASVTTFWDSYAVRLAYWQSWWASFRRVVSGFLLAQVLGVPLGLLLGTRARLRELIYPVLELLRPIPPLAWVPLSILFWPTTELSIVFITFLGAFFIIVINVHDAVRTVKQEHLWLARSLGAGEAMIFRRVILPSVLPAVGVGMTLGMAVTWNVVIAAEMIAGDTGLGRLTWEGYVSHTSTVVIIGMVSIGLAGYLSALVIHHVEGKLMPWRAPGK